MIATLPTLPTSAATVNYRWDETNQIHYIEFLEASRQSIEEWVGIMDQIYEGLTDNDTVRIIIDERKSGALPLTYSINRGRRWAATLKHHPKAIVGFIFPDNAIRSLANSLLSLLRMGHLRVKMFAPNEEAQAIEWIARQ